MKFHKIKKKRLGVSNLNSTIHNENIYLLWQCIFPSKVLNYWPNIFINCWVSLKNNKTRLMKNGNLYAKSILDIGVTLKQIIVDTWNVHWIFILAFSTLN